MPRHSNHKHTDRDPARYQGAKQHDPGLQQCEESQMRTVVYADARGAAAQVKGICREIGVQLVTETREQWRQTGRGP